VIELFLREICLIVFPKCSKIHLKGTGSSSLKKRERFQLVKKRGSLERLFQEWETKEQERRSWRLLRKESKWKETSRGRIEKISKEAPVGIIISRLLPIVSKENFASFDSLSISLLFVIRSRQRPDGEMLTYWTFRFKTVSMDTQVNRKVQ